MAQRGKHRADEALLTALACGATVDNAARSAGVSVRTAHRRLAEPGFQERLEVVRGEHRQRTTDMLSAASLESIRTLLALQQPSMPPSVRLGAARTVVDLSLKVWEQNELSKRIAALEAQVGWATPLPKSA
jgi:hypothetical protein